MEKLSLEEILKIPDLLFSPDEANKMIAIQLLEQHSYAIHRLLVPIEIFLAFHSEYKLLPVIQKALPDFKLEESPIYLIYLLHKQKRYIKNLPTLLNRFSVNELNYRPWLLKDPQKAVIYASIGEKYCSKDTLSEKGFIYYKRAFEHSPPNIKIAIPYLLLLQEKYSLDNTLDLHKTEIIAHYNQAYEEHKSAIFLNSLASFYQKKLKNKAAAIATWKRSIQEQPRFNFAFFTYARFLIEEKEWANAKVLMEECLNLARSKAQHNLDEIYYLLGFIEWRGFQDFLIAEKYFEKALEENEFYSKPLEALMELSLENEDYTKAIRWHKAALKERPFDIHLMLKIAELYLEIYDLEEAAYYYTEILELNAAYAPALEGLKKIEQL